MTPLSSNNPSRPSGRMSSVAALGHQETARSSAPDSNNNTNVGLGPRRKIVRREELMERTGTGRSMSFYRADPLSPYFCELFPKPVKLGGLNSRSRAVGFYEDEIDAFLASLPRA